MILMLRIMILAAALYNLRKLAIFGASPDGPTSDGKAVTEVTCHFPHSDTDAPTAQSHQGEMCYEKFRVLTD